MAKWRLGGGGTMRRRTHVEYFEYKCRKNDKSSRKTLIYLPRSCCILCMISLGMRSATRGLVATSCQWLKRRFVDDWVHAEGRDSR